MVDKDRPVGKESEAESTAEKESAAVKASATSVEQVADTVDPEKMSEDILVAELNTPLKQSGVPYHPDWSGALGVVNG